MSAPFFLSSRAVIRLSGPDWPTFLNGLLTQSTLDLPASTAVFAGLLTPQGKLISDVMVRSLDPEAALLDVPAARAETVLARLSLYRLRAKVALEAAPDLTVIAGGPDQARPDSAFTDPRLAALGWRACVPRGPELESCTPEADWHRLRLSLGVPDPDADCPLESTYPIEACFDWLNGIDFHKGCFVGQETTSRMKRRGTVKTRMMPVQISGETLPAFGTEILNGDLRAGVLLSGIEDRAIASLRLDRLDGPLTCDGLPVSVTVPSWWPEDGALIAPSA
ncbi:MAG: YgfZ/GcvT domain-containing protein [Asticcacaulis sp.]